MRAEPTVRGGADDTSSRHEARRLSAALIRISGAVGAFGGLLVNVAFRESFLTWVSYLRSSARLAGV